ncbi:hypothetical protein TS85_05275 [Sphingomonas hengshuiensis]|uniref:Peptidase S8/S53 domain-containing protein n=1 Tax=Sphingomonas hengshuiensis TaxID=1609977 RepID=A0A7U4J717_9SPHN|nr:hypothetical protein TS85_05275 [Sphingomonas hengshuiensis]
MVAGKPQFWPKGARALTYAVDRNSFPDTATYDLVVKSLGAAAKEWMNVCITCGLSIRHLTEQDLAPKEGQSTFIVRYNKVPSPYLALAFFPGDASEKRYLHVFPGYADTSYDYVGVFRHELGHILGYRHENIQKDAGCWQAESGSWMPLSDYDPRSVMHYFCKDPAGLKLALTETDRTSHTAVYSGAGPPKGPIEHGTPGEGSAGLVQTVPVASQDRATSLQDAVPGQQRPDQPALRISFLGGTVMTDMAATLNRLAAAPRILRTETMQVTRGQTPESLLKTLGVPISNAGIEQLLRTLNGPGFDSRKVKAGETIVLPSLRVTTRRTARVFIPRDRAEQAEKRAILNGWQSKSTILQSVNGFDRVEFNAYDATIPLDSDVQVVAALLRLTVPEAKSLRSQNVIIDTQLTQSRPAKAFSTDQDYKSMCGPPQAEGGKPAPPPSTLGYEFFVDADKDLGPQLAKLPPPNGKPVVYIIDTKVQPNPALSGALLDSPAAASISPWNCRWVDFVEALHHGNHMAGIIASRNNQGFIGLASTALIGSIEWHRADQGTPPKLVQTSDREYRLATVIDQVTGQPGLDVFLIASEFKQYTETELDKEGQLRSAATRQNFTLAHKAVFEARPLLIAAAGQSENGSPPVRLTTTSAHAPQGLGDLENVVVVTACEICTRGKVVLQPSAFFGVWPDPIVHLAAPGGKPLPGWVSSAEVSASQGTSPAAAYVSGVAADMIARYPALYLQAEQVKRRLQLTAWPILPTSDPMDTAWTKVASGVVDYQRAMLDPSQTWLKDAGGWRDVKLKGWSGSLRFIDAEGNIEVFDSDRVLRVLNVSPGKPEASFALYLASEKTPRKRGYVRRWGPMSLMDGQAKLLLCDGSVLVADIEEVILPTITRGPTVCE